MHRILPTITYTAVLTLTAMALGADSRPNVLLIFTDDQGIHDVGCYGSEIPTPHIDSLARDGLKFTSWYSASSICTPSRYGLLTGRNPCRSRDQLLGALMFLSDDDRDRGIQQGETTLAELLQKAGYRTALIGKWHLGHGDRRFWPTRHGFDTFYGHTGGCVDFFTMRYGNTPDWYRNEELLDATGYATDLLTDEAVRFIAGQDKTTPFLLYLSYNAPHFGKGWNDGAGTTVNQLQPHPAHLARVSSIRDITRRKYAAKVVNLDDGIGRVLSALDNQQLTNRTLVIFITDHGGDPVYGGANQPFRDGKATLFEGGLRVPCLMRWPRHIQAGSVTDAVASSLDILPTICQLCGVQYGGEIDGQDISTLLQDAAVVTRPRELYWELGAHDHLGRGKWMAIRQDKWKYIRDHQGREYLFNVADDPHEHENVASTRVAIRDKLRERSLEKSREFSTSWTQTALSEKGER